MRLAIMLFNCKDTNRVTDYGPDFVRKIAARVEEYYRKQSGGQLALSTVVWGWHKLSMTSAQWDSWGTNVGPQALPELEQEIGLELSTYDRYVMVIDKPGANGGRIHSDKYMALSAKDLTPALMAHEIGHWLGAGHANLDSATGGLEYWGRFCIMGGEGDKHSFQDPGLRLKVNIPLVKNKWDWSHTARGPAMCAPNLDFCGWLDLARNGVNLTQQLTKGTGQADVEILPLDGSPKAGTSHKVVAYADDLDSAGRLMIEYRRPTGMDYGLPETDTGWIVAHLRLVENGLRSVVQIGAVEAVAGNVLTTSRGGLRLTVKGASTSSVWLHLRAVTQVSLMPRASVASWGVDRLDLFSRGSDLRGRHKAYATAWIPDDHWERIDGRFLGPPAVASWGPERLDIFAVDANREMRHKAWANKWYPSQTGWERLGGKFISPPAVCSWGPDRLDIFAVDTGGQIVHKAWASQYYPSNNGWEKLGGSFVNAPAVCSWGPDRIDIVAVDREGRLRHKIWNGDWQPGLRDWDTLGEGFSGVPAICSQAPGYLDVFATRQDGSLWHKKWEPDAPPSPAEWTPLGGWLLGAPAVASWKPGRLDVFGVGIDGAMYHKGWDGAWDPQGSGWRNLGGNFISPPAVVSWGPNRLDIFATGLDSQLRHKARAGNQWWPSLKDWETMGGVVK